MEANNNQKYIQRGNKANISESQKEIFLVNISKVYELVKITQNEKITEKCKKCKQL